MKTANGAKKKGRTLEEGTLKVWIINAAIVVGAVMVSIMFAVLFVKATLAKDPSGAIVAYTLSTDETTGVSAEVIEARWMDSSGPTDWAFLVRRSDNGNIGIVYVGVEDYVRLRNEKTLYLKR
ncbi:hypothetical protein HY419_01095 [candidate division WWE3 bacterium]|nr:hypothetical protein [candidate division WWE3 bacterium]